MNRLSEDELMMKEKLCFGHCSVYNKVMNHE